MDPDVALTQIRTLTEEIRHLGNAAVLTRDQREVLQADAVELADAVSDLDEWLSGGGFVPAAWLTQKEQEGRSATGNS